METNFFFKAWSDSLRAELASEGVSVLVISPGYVKTELSRNAITDKVNLSADQQMYKSGIKGCCTWGNGSEHRKRLQCRLGGREGVGGYAKGRSGGEASP